MKRATRKTLRGRRTGEQGFTLLETLVALVIISLALGMAVQSVALASSRIVASREARQIERYARGLLANPPSQAGRDGRGRQEERYASRDRGRSGRRDRNETGQSRYGDDHDQGIERAKPPFPDDLYRGRFGMKRRTPIRKRVTVGEAGFGLTEMLVVLFITSAMGLVMLPMLSQLRPIRDRQEQVETLQAMEATVRHMARVVEAAELIVLPPEASEEAEAGTRYLEGKADEIRFNAVVRRGARTIGLAEVRFFVDRSGATPRLVQEMRNRRRRGVQRVTLADNVSSFRLGYSGGGGGAGDPAGWSREWDSEGKLPGTVGITVAREAPNGETISLNAVANLLVQN
jgi:prepilin-type N-terminal cleavage/methylation domain-containing protein